jgi:hypothetical protein
LYKIYAIKNMGGDYVKEHKMKSSVMAGEREGQYLLVMDEKINKLRKEIWKTIFGKNKELNLSDCDVALALGMVTYELIHHSNPEELRNVASSEEQ